MATGMWGLLFGSTALVAALPMLPALLEWWRPSDAQPLHVDTQDALEPDQLARAFAQRLAQALDDGEAAIGRHALVRLPPSGDWALAADEALHRRSHRVWFAAGDAVLPPGIAWLGEVAAGGSLDASSAATCRALLAQQGLRLGPRTRLLRWAQGQEVEVDGGAVLDGRVTAGRWLRLRGAVRFTLLHAPLVRFGGAATVGAVAMTPCPSPLLSPPSLPRALPAGLPIDWHPAAHRGIAGGDLRLPADSGWQGDIVCAGRLEIGPGSLAQGSLKARHSVHVGEGSRIEGNVIAEGPIELGAGCVVHGVVVSETAVVLGPGCVVGRPEVWATVAAPRIDVADAVCVHGTVWAGEAGQAGVAAASSACLDNLADGPLAPRAAGAALGVAT